MEYRSIIIFKMSAKVVTIEWWNLTKSPIREIKVYVFFETQLENGKCLEEDFMKTKYLKEINAKTDAPRNAAKQYF